MRRRSAFRGAILMLSAAAVAGLATSPAQAREAGAGRAAKHSKKAVFEACAHGCRYRTIQRAVDAAGSFEFRHPGERVVVAIRPGRYAEGVVVDGTERRKDFDRLTIEGTKRDRKRVILEGGGAGGGPGAAQDGIEAIGVEGIVLRNMWARNYRSSGFFVHAGGGGQPCVGYTMDNLLASANRSAGLAAKGCLGGRIVNSAGFHHGGSGFEVAETPCDSASWTNHGPNPVPCQRQPRWTLLKDDVGYENALGYAGTNAKYVRIVESVAYDNGTGIALGTLDSEGHEPNGWNVVERNDVFWNNYDYTLAGSAFRAASPGLGQLAGRTVNYPIGVGIVVYGGDGNVVRRNKVFGNYKWGIASFSGPGETFVLNEGDDAKNVDNQISENTMGRESADPNGEYDFFDDGSGGGNCWGGNNLIATFAPGNGKVPLSVLYPPCPQPPVSADSVRSLDTTAGLQVNLSSGQFGDPRTILGYAGTDPPQDQQCSWVRRVAVHPPFQNYKPVEVTPAPGEVSC